MRMLDQISTEMMITWAGMTLLLIGGLKVGLNGTKQAVQETRTDVGKIAARITEHGESIATLNERTTNIAADVGRLESRLDA